MAEQARILIVDDDPVVAESLAEFLGAEGHQTAMAREAAEALAMLSQCDGPRAEAGSRPFNVMLIDVSLPGMDGFELLRRVVKTYGRTVPIMITGYGTVESAVQALRLGASDYLTKPIVDQELRFSLERALRQQALLAENQALRTQLDTRFGLANIVGSDHRMQRVYDLIEAVAPSRTTVLMTGESGVGKSLIAHAIHHASPRRGKAFVEISCGSIPETLLESELFGHVKGAFTGAHADKAGRFLAANGGTIFLDEINSASPGMQLKLLRVLQERRFEPVGSTQTVEVDVRIVLASNQPLEQLVAEGTFRQDLYYRINVVRIELPPLRDRLGDIPLLAQHFLQHHAKELGKVLTGFSAEAMDVLRRYIYPGNVRELQNIVERAAVLSQRPTIDIDDLPAHIVGEPDRNPLAILPASAAAAVDVDNAPWIPMKLEDALREPERRVISRALKANHWNRQKTADQLGINRTTLYKKMKQYGIDARESDAA
jgi:DNA-binding NtrC family response regulator